MWKDFATARLLKPAEAKQQRSRHCMTVKVLSTLEIKKAQENRPVFSARVMVAINKNIRKYGQDIFSTVIGPYIQNVSGKYSMDYYRKTIKRQITDYFVGR